MSWLCALLWQTDKLYFVKEGQLMDIKIRRRPWEKTLRLDVVKALESDGWTEFRSDFTGLGF